MPRLNAKTAKAFRREARKHNPDPTPNYVEDVKRRKVHYLPFTDKDGKPISYSKGGPVYVETNCFRGAYRSLKRIYKKHGNNITNLVEFNDDTND